MLYGSTALQETRHFYTSLTQCLKLGHPKNSSELWEALHPLLREVLSLAACLFPLRNPNLRDVEGAFSETTSLGWAYQRYWAYNLGKLKNAPQVASDAFEAIFNIFLEVISIEQRTPHTSLSFFANLPSFTDSLLLFISVVHAQLIHPLSVASKGLEQDEQRTIDYKLYWQEYMVRQHKLFYLETRQQLWVAFRTSYGLKHVQLMIGGSTLSRLRTIFGRF